MDIKTSDTETPHAICQTCQHHYLITQDELDFYDKVSPEINGKKLLIGPQRLCTDCRQKRRLRFRNERNLYARPCDMCKTDIIALYPQDTPGLVYCPQCWWSDTWDAFGYGIDIDWSQTILSHCKRLLAHVPKLSLINLNSENSTYAHDAENNKNCYLVFSTIHSQDSLYITDSARMRNCVDCFWSVNCELCYNVISASDCYNSFHSTHCYQISFCYFCYDCQNCTNCFGCFHLNHKEYYIFNQPYSKDEYEKRLAVLQDRMKTWQGYEQVSSEVQTFWQNQPHQYAANTSLNSTGDFLVDCKNCFDSFNVVSSLDCKHLYDCVDMKDSQDCNLCGHAELIYNCQSCTGFMNVCCSFCSHSSNMAYCDHCFSCSNCFGCVGLSHQAYCVFNKQYSKDEYEELLPRLVAHMKEQWGEFFPQDIAPIAEKDCVMADYFPPLGSKRIDDIVKETAVLPEVKNNKTECVICQKSYLIIKQEQEFLNTHHLPIPPLCPTCRHKRRIQQRNPRELYQRHCQHCNQVVTSTFPPKSTITVYCEKCYQESMA